MTAIPIVDYAGPCPFGFIQYWADWDEVDQRVYFGGAWDRVPSMPCWSQPTAESVTHWANVHGGDWYKNEEAYYADTFDLTHCCWSFRQGN